MHEGQCSECKRTTLVVGTTRKGGGTYRRGGRCRRTSVCHACAASLLQHAGTHAGASIHGLGARSLARIAAASDDPDHQAAAREWTARDNEARGQRQADREARDA